MSFFRRFVGIHFSRRLEKKKNHVTFANRFFIVPLRVERFVVETFRVRAIFFLFERAILRLVLRDRTVLFSERPAGVFGLRGLKDSRWSRTVNLCVYVYDIKHTHVYFSCKLGNLPNIHNIYIYTHAYVYNI